MDGSDGDWHEEWQVSCWWRGEQVVWGISRWRSHGGEKQVWWGKADVGINRWDQGEQVELG